MDHLKNIFHFFSKETHLLEPKKILLVDGILILSQKQLLPLYDISYYIECDSDTRFKRRLSRDVAERGRTPEGVKDQFFKQVEPMHSEFVRPSKDNAQIVLSQNEYIENAESYINDLRDTYLKSRFLQET